MLKLPNWFKDFAMCFSLANLCYLRSWAALQDAHNPARYYFARQEDSFEVEFLTVVNVLLLTGILRLLLSIVRDSRSRLIRAVSALFLGSAFVVAGPQLLVVLYKGHQDVFASALARISPGIITALIVPLALTAFLVTGWLRAAIKFARAFTLFMFPQALLNLAQVGWWVFTAVPAYAYLDRSPVIHAPLHRLSQTSRIVWLVFDEFDERLGFEERPADLQLQDLDRLRSESVFATAAHSPAHDTTESLPSLITGRAVQQVAVNGPSELMLRYKGESSYVPWSREQNVFRAAHQFGLRTALVGWFHPYCRVISSDLDSCAWYSAHELSPGQDWKVYTESLGLLGALADRLSPFNAQGGDLGQEALKIRKTRMEMAVDFRARALSLATDSRYDVVFMHLPIPHPPAIYDRSIRSFTTAGNQNYADNLQATNDLVRDLRAAMESSGLWDQSAIIISSDHPLRHDPDRLDFVEQDLRLTGGFTHDRIPFLLKLPNQRSGTSFQPDFNTVRTAALIESIIRGEVKTPVQATAWMSAHGGK